MRSRSAEQSMRQWSVFTTAGAGLVLLLAACGAGGQKANPQQPPPVSSAKSGPSRAATGSPASSAATAAAPVCIGSGAHDKHGSVGLTCQTCHPCGGQFGFPTPPFTFPGGTSTANGQIFIGQNGQPTTCMIGCHNPLGASGQVVSWNTPGPLGCISCHSQIVPPTMNVKSSHPIDFTSAIANRVGCQSCHDTSAHLSGQVRIVTGDGGADTACLDCHSRNSTPLSGKTPPLLVGWTTLNGDWHGTRAGTGFGGTLLAPYARGQAPLACTACHVPHASANSFLFASTVNGTPLPVGQIDRAGVGAEALCQSCHTGQRHASCATACHDHYGSVVGHTSDPAPPGKPCFFCHGHEGITTSFPAYDLNAATAFNCVHCHGGWMPATSDTPPVIASGPTLAVTGTTATITWTTLGTSNGLATGYVEYGTGALSTIAGDNTMSVRHTVALTGLQDRTTYSFRVRSTDQFRNVTLSAIQTFTVGAPPSPTPAHQADLWGVATQANVVLTWNSVTDPHGETVKYRVQIARTADFSDTVVLSDWAFGTSFPATLATDTTYYWRVMAESSVSQLMSQWSGADSFTVNSAPYCDPYYCY